MILWTSDLRRLGFREKGHRYWQCDRGYGLPNDAHLSLFLWTHARASPRHSCYEFAEFHVTFEVAGHNVHFYYHEVDENRWAAEGHTSRSECDLLGIDVDALRSIADAIAARVVERFSGVLESR